MRDRDRLPSPDSLTDAGFGGQWFKMLPAAVFPLSRLLASAGVKEMPWT